MAGGCCARTIRVVWNGNDDRNALTIAVEDGPKNAPSPAISHFAYGIVTFNVNYLFRTPPGYNLWARGPANLPKHGIQALEGIIETDWSVAPFTMNWKVTAANLPVTFEIGEPICMISPIKRGELESFTPRLADLASDPNLQKGYVRWYESRNRFNRELAKGTDWAQAKAWQKDYIRGLGPGVRADEHQTKLKVREFQKD